MCFSPISLQILLVHFNLLTDLLEEALSGHIAQSVIVAEVIDDLLGSVVLEYSDVLGVSTIQLHF